MNNRMTLELPSLSENGPFARDAVAAFCARLDPTLDELSDVKTAVSEAVTNCIVHAYPNAPGTVRIECAAGRGALHIRVIDYGRGIANVARALEPFYTTLAGEERSGMGFTIMQAFMTNFSVHSEEGKGTTVCMRKVFARGQAGESPAAESEAGGSKRAVMRQEAETRGRGTPAAESGADGGAEDEKEAGAAGEPSSPAQTDAPRARAADARR